MKQSIEQTPEEHERKVRDFNRKAAIVTGVAVALLAVAVIVLFFIVTPTLVSGESMLPTLEDGQHMMVLKVGYDVNKGDIIVFERPGSENPPVKRVIAMGGDTVRFRDGVWYVNDEALYEDYILGDGYPSDYMTLGDPAVSSALIGGGLTLAEDELFVLGDNRRISYDSHSYGAIKRDWIVGKVVAVY